MIVFDDRDALAEIHFNAIGLVDGRQLNITQEEFAARFHLPLGTVRDWEQGAHRPDRAAEVLLTVIAKDPDAVARALEV